MIPGNMETSRERFMYDPNRQSLARDIGEIADTKAVVSKQLSQPGLVSEMKYRAEIMKGRQRRRSMGWGSTTVDMSQR